MEKAAQTVERYRAELSKRASAVPKAERQRIIDLAWESNRFGAISEAVGLDLMVVSQIIVDNIIGEEGCHTLRKRVC